MSDRELLELAAKAAGYTALNWSMLRQCYYDGSGVYWMPLDDDGDALRLAVKLGIHLTNSQSDAWASREDATAIEPIFTDAYKSTRRAIVRAAAAIGRAMP